MGSFIGLAGRFALRYFVLAAAHALWVAGFDVIYALQDIDFDRREGLYSVPARFGMRGGRVIALLSHLGALGALFLVPRFWPLSPWYFVGAGIAAVLLAAEHLVALGGEERHIRIASYSINEVVPLVVLAGTALGLYL
jgi:4-hydroxybenzoate polyprenyltransferase